MNYVPRFITVVLTLCTIASAQVQRHSRVDKTYTYGTKDTVWLAPIPYPGWRGTIRSQVQVQGDTIRASKPSELPPYVGVVAAPKLAMRMLDANSDSVKAYVQYIMYDSMMVSLDSTFVRGTSSTVGLLLKNGWTVVPLSTTTLRPYEYRIICTIAESDSPQVAGKRVRWELFNETTIHQDF